jgi:hypothetical protein
VVACVAWGRLIETALGRWGGATPVPNLSTGTAGCVGLAAFLCGAGAFVAFNQYRPLFAWLWILAGFALAIRALAQRREGDWTTLRPGGLAAATLGVLGVEAVYETGNSLGLFRWNPCDDFAAYLPLLHRLSQTGGMIEPFSLRRITGLGGATVSDSLFTSTFGLNAAYVGDFVIGALLVGLLLMVPSPKWPRFALGALLTVSFVLWENLKVNLTPTYVATALIAAAVLLVAETKRTRADLLDRRLLVLVGLLCAGLLTLRTPDAVPVALLALALIVRASAPVRERLRAALFFFLATALFAAPWMIALWRSSGTPLYPPIAGNFTTSWPGLRVSGDDLPSRLVDALGANPLAWILAGILAAGIALIVLRRTSEWAKTPILAACAAEATAIALVVTTGAASDDLARYAWPLLAGVLIATLALLADQVEWPLQSSRDRTAALVVLAVALAVPIASPVGGEIDRGATGVANVFSGDDNSLVTIDRFRYEYGVAQASTPRRAKVAITADNPFYFDYGRNDLVNLDVLGAVSPAPGLPLGGSTASTTDYLRDKGFQFVIGTDPRTSLCLYSEKGWKINLARHKPEASQAPYFLDWFDWQRRRARQAPRRTTRYASLTVFDLRGDR